MAVYGNMALTDQGMALYSKAQTGVLLNFSRMQIGSGKLAAGQDPTKLTALITPISNFAINSITSSGNTSAVKGVFENSSITVPTYSCELGLFAQDPVAGEILYAYANAGDFGDTIPPISSGPLSKQYQINAAIGNATNVTATIPAGAYATIDQLNTHMADQAAHGATSAATPSKIVSRDVNGRFKAANPAAADDVATKGSADAAISAAINALINSAPGALDTLKELADAMGDDPNFATTVTTSLAGKASAVSVSSIDTRLTKLDNRYKKTVVSSDANGKPTQIDYKRLDNTLYLRVTQSGAPDLNGNYPTIITKEYAADGVTIIPNGTITYTCTYDTFGNMSNDGGIAS